jgi:hypothetical protein
MRKKPPAVNLASVRGTCGVCRYWRPYDSDTQELSETGECRRYPATQFAFLDEDGEPAFASEFPQHDQEDWCGEFSPAN